MARTLKYIFIGTAGVVLLFFIGSRLSARADEAGKSTLRTEGVALVRETIERFDVGADKQPGVSISKGVECDLRSEKMMQSAYLKCYVTKSVKAVPTSDVARDITGYRNFYDAIIQDGWSKEISTVDTTGGRYLKSTTTVASGKDLQADSIGNFEINTSRMLPNGVRCLLWSHYYPPALGVTGKILSKGDASLTVSCDFKGSSESIFNHPIAD